MGKGGNQCPSAPVPPFAFCSAAAGAAEVRQPGAEVAGGPHSGAVLHAGRPLRQAGGGAGPGQGRPIRMQHSGSGGQMWSFRSSSRKEEGFVRQV